MSERNLVTLAMIRPLSSGHSFAMGKKCVLVSFEMWCWTRMVEISWTDRAKYEVLRRAKEERNI